MLARIWLEEGKIRCCSQVCDEGCPRFSQCMECEVHTHEFVSSNRLEMLETLARKLESLLERMLTICVDAGPASISFSELECRALLKDIDKVWCEVQREYASIWKEVRSSV